MIHTANNDSLSTIIKEGADRMQRKLSIILLLSLVSYSFRINTNNFYQTFFSKNDLVFDVGANIGAKTDQYLSLGARVVCIEPQSDCCDKLRKKYQHNNKVSIVESGVGEKPGVLELFVCSSSNAISTFSQEWVSASRFTEIGYKWDKKISVPVITLDHLIKQFGVPQFCKIDVENYELPVLKGLSTPIPFISFEFAFETMHNTKECLNVLSKMGYTEFNFALAETPQLILDEWVDKQKLINIIEIKSKENIEIWGDIYAHYS